MPTPLREFLTTGQAAKLCSVTPDTVLKWIKRGKIPAIRTAGGHYRISRQDLRPFLACRSSPATDAGALPPADPHRTALRQTSEPETGCWEVMAAESGKILGACKQCVVYRVRATRCFLLAGMVTVEGHARLFCRGSCLECAYYRRVMDTLQQVLVITADPELVARLEGYGDNGFVVRVARNGYEASAMLEQCRPAAIFLDIEGIPDGGQALLDSMAADPRIAGVPVTLAVPPYPSLQLARKHPIVRGIVEKPHICRDLSLLMTG